MTVLASIDLQTLGDAFGQGAIYALMAVGIGLVFGVLRLVNFAYGQLIMEVCDRIHVLDQGRTLAAGTPEEIRGDLDVAAAYLGESAVDTDA